MHLILARTAYCETESLEHILEQIGCKRSDSGQLLEGSRAKDIEKTIERLPSPSMMLAEQIGGLGKVAAWMKASDEVRLLALHTPPELAIARAVEHEGQTLTEASRAWAESARELLAADRPNRNRSLVLHAVTAHADQQGFATKVTNFLGSGLADNKGENAGDESRESSHLHRVIAAQVVAASPELQDLRDELEARSTPLAMDPQEVAADCEQALVELTRVHDEKDEFLRRMHEAQEELERYFLDAKEKKSRQEELAKENSKLKSSEKDLKKQVERLKAENQKVQKDREATEKKNTQLREQKNNLQEDLRKLREQRDRARHHLHNMKNSRSWKLTAPLRGFGRKGESASDRSTEA